MKKRLHVMVMSLFLALVLIGCEFLPDENVESINVAEASLQEVYTVQAFDLETISIQVTYEDGSYIYVPLDESFIHEADRDLLLMPGEHTIRVEYHDMTTSFPLRLVEDESALLLYRIYQLGVHDEALDEGYETWKESLRGERVELNLTDTHLVWRYEAETDWRTLLNLEDLEGSDGRSIELSVEDNILKWRYEGDETFIGLYEIPIPEDGVPVELDVIDDVLFWRYVNEAEWRLLLEMSDLRGADGREIELAVEDDIILWRYEGDSDYQELFGAHELAGDDGREIELSVTDNMLQWRYVGDESYEDLFEIPEPEDGVPVELDVIEGDLVWRYIGEDTWRFLMTIDDNGDIITEEPIEALIATVQDSVLAVISENVDEAVSLGSGVVYDYADGWYYLFTNHHVIEDFVNISLYYQKYGNTFVIGFDDIEFLGSYERADIALLRFQSDQDFNLVAFADSFELKAGQAVYAIGHPGNLSHYGSVTSGIISKLNINMQLDDTNAFFIKHDAAINPGNSGGPLLNAFGEVIGMNTLKTIGADIEGQGYALPSNSMVRMLDDLKDDGVVRRAMLGVTITSDITTCGALRGVCITDVSSNTTASKLELEPGDIIRGIKTDMMDDYLEVDNFDFFAKVMQSFSPGTTISLRINRNDVLFETGYEPLDTNPEDLDE